MTNWKVYVMDNETEKNRLLNMNTIDNKSLNNIIFLLLGVIVIALM